MGFEMSQTFTIYKVFYLDGDGCPFLVYVGRTKRQLQDRLRGHFMRSSRNGVTKPLELTEDTIITYAECKSEADMNLYEIYYILTEKPLLNSDDKAKDDLTVKISGELAFKEWTNPLLEKWKARACRSEL